jgi:deoxyhypusine synthase
MTDDDAADADQHGGDGSPERREFSHDPVGHAEVRAGMGVGDLVEQYDQAGIGAADLHEAVDVAAEMFADSEVAVFFGLAGAMVPAGMRAVVADLIRDGYVDAFVATGATLTHDAIEAIGGKHHHGSTGPPRQHGGSEPDQSDEDHDGEGAGSLREHDERLRDEEVDRIYNVYLPQEHFALFEDHLRSEVFPVLEAECEADGNGGTVSIERFTRELGRANAEVNERDGIEEGPGIAAAAHEHDVPIYCPAIQDSVLGLQAWMYAQTSAFSLAALSDMSDLNDQAYHAEKTAALVVGGGVPKNYVLQTMLVTPASYDYGLQLTMDPPQTGGLSGATLEEARSWGKFEKAARNVSVYADATITLPLLVAGARDRIE